MKCKIEKRPYPPIKAYITFEAENAKDRRILKWIIRECSWIIPTGSSIQYDGSLVSLGPARAIVCEKGRER